jgi:hypothetical protein
LYISNDTFLIGTLPTGGNGVALADGTIALLSAKDTNGELEWGIASDYNQLLLSYPSIGCASLMWNVTSPSMAPPTSDRQHIPHVACCLRGGTTYVVPVFPTASEEDTDDSVGEATPLTVFSLDAETDSNYMQSFTAGNMILAPGDSSSRDENASDHSHHHDSEPVLIYGWAGGIVDIYSCELMVNSTNKESSASATRGTACRAMMGHREISILEELVANGSARMLRELLPALQDSDPLLQQPRWVQALEECRRQRSDTSKDDNSAYDDLTVEKLLQPEYTAFRSLLLLMSTNKHTLPPEIPWKSTSNKDKI